jgi:hypothetical protein
MLVGEVKITPIIGEARQVGVMRSFWDGSRDVVLEVHIFNEHVIQNSKPLFVVDPPKLPDNWGYYKMLNSRGQLLHIYRLDHKDNNWYRWNRSRSKDVTKMEREDIHKIIAEGATLEFIG